MGQARIENNFYLFIYLLCEFADAETWHRLAELPFVDASRSPALTRALYIPFVSASRNAMGSYQLLQRRQVAPQ